VAYGAVQGETQNRGGEQLVAASRVLLRSLIDFILELLRELQGDGNCHYKQPRSLAMIRTQSMEICKNVGSELTRIQFYLEVEILMEDVKIYERLSSGLGKLQFYFEIENLVEDVKIYQSSGPGLRKCSFM
jgi:hypothetical protein